MLHLVSDTTRSNQIASASTLDSTHSHLTRFQVRIGAMAPPRDSLAMVLAKLEELGKKADETILRTDDTYRKIEEMQNSIQLLSDEKGVVKVWRPMIETKVVDLQNSVYDLKQKVDLFIHQLPKTSSSGDGKHAHEMSAPAHLGATADAGTSGQFGHGKDPQHRSVGAGVVTTLVPPPVTGARFSPKSYPCFFFWIQSRLHTSCSFSCCFWSCCTTARLSQIRWH